MISSSNQRVQLDTNNKETIIGNTSGTVKAPNETKKKRRRNKKVKTTVQWEDHIATKEESVESTHVAQFVECDQIQTISTSNHNTNQVPKQPKNHKNTFTPSRNDYQTNKQISFLRDCGLCEMQKPHERNFVGRLKRHCK